MVYAVLLLKFDWTYINYRLFLFTSSIGKAYSVQNDSNAIYYN